MTTNKKLEKLAYRLHHIVHLANNAWVLAIEYELNDSEKNNKQNIYKICEYLEEVESEVSYLYKYIAKNKDI